MRVHKVLVLLAASVLALPLAACEKGIRFASVEVNRPLPEDMRTRILYAKTDIFKYRLSQLAGFILVDEPGPGDYVRVDRLLPGGVEPAADEITAETGRIYSCVVDQGAALEGTYLAFAASLKANMVAEVEIRDRYLVFINYSQALADEIANWVRNNPNTTPGTKRWYIQGALLASITTDYYRSIQADASGVVGDTLGAKGSVYNKMKETVTDFRISLELIDIDKVAALPPGLAPEDVRDRIRHAGQQIIDFED